MQLAEPPVTTTWRAQLALRYERRDEFGAARTVLAERRHDGPLVVQKTLYPEGDAVCHNIIVHPPAGIAGGDDLAIDAHVGARAHALLTTPGAAKWYRSTGAWAQQRNVFTVDEGACLEWLPQESIVFDGALARLECEVRLGARASYIGWEVLCLGRAGSGERFMRGQCRSTLSVLRHGKPLWWERGGFTAGDVLTRSPAGLNGNSVCGTWVAAADCVARVDLAACRAIAAASGATAVTRLPGVLVARYLGESSEAAKQYFAALWHAVRPAIAGREAVAPRIWST